MKEVDAEELALSDHGQGVRLPVRVKPRSSRSGPVAIRDGALVVAVRAPPVEGKANAELLKVLAKVLGVPRSRLALAAGATGRHKLVDVMGMDVAAVRARLRETLG